ncbi:hypothetical protein RclHR1_09730008 [Rhizophagus clarus]|uniref:Uncharacterized protein n=1 Tax=Rhizophagus clarus TaxID=94130 RepID=A0A2Z6SJ43_9GLOM|nr:hypothetical protein RclHR1_09730008 [Rhizophagus clarus]
MKLLASYDNANHYSYLPIFFPARYKARRSMWKFSQLSAKKIRKRNMANITLNCVIIPTGGFIGIPNNDVNLTVTIPLGNTVRNLHTQI